MTLPKQKTFLPNRLSQLILKTNSYFIKRLVLLEQSSQLQKSVRHYDLECEGIQVLVGFIKKKQQTLFLKAFSLIKDNRICYTARPTVTDRKQAVGTTRRTYLNSTFTVSEASPIKMVSPHLLPINKQVREQDYFGESNAKKSSMDLKKLLNRVKMVNSNSKLNATFCHQRFKTQMMPLRQNASFYAGGQRNSRQLHNGYYHSNPSQANYKDINYFQYYQSQLLSTKNSRRRYIMDKFDEIENNLHLLDNEQQILGSELSEDLLNEINNLKQKLRVKNRRPYYKG